jgi:hypothetical protein
MISPLEKKVLDEVIDIIEQERYALEEENQRFEGYLPINEAQRDMLSRLMREIQFRFK